MNRSEKQLKLGISLSLGYRDSLLQVEKQLKNCFSYSGNEKHNSRAAL